MSVLSEELTADPLGRGYAQFIPDAPGVLAEMMNALEFDGIGEKFVTGLGLLAQFGTAGASMLEKLESAGSSNPAVKWAMRFVTGTGIDVGHPTTRWLLDALVPDVLTSEEAERIKALAATKVSRAAQLSIQRVTEADIREALGL